MRRHAQARAHACGGRLAAVVPRAEVHGAADGHTKVQVRVVVPCCRGLFCKLALSKNKLPDIVIMDYHLKNTTGPEAVRRIRTVMPLEATQNMLVIGLTGDVDSTQVQDGFCTIGIDHVLCKPTTIMQIKQTFLTLLSAARRKKQKSAKSNTLAQHDR